MRGSVTFPPGGLRMREPCFGAVGNFSILIHLFGAASCEKWMRPTSANLYESFQDAYKWKMHSYQPHQALPDSLQLCAVK
ncbi:uncharacterized protein [Chlorocebus sabaeus]|uniref:uncharacterized protein n=1 Tax=Chlorocebus sabaeus TaxID=60711 RepID=UPI003BFA0B8A